MSKRNLQSFWGTLGDVFRETTWPMRVGMFLGIAAGVFVSYLLLSSAAVTEGRWMAWRFLLVLCILGLFVCGFLGMVLGSLLDSAFNSKSGEKEKRNTPRSPR